MKKGTRYFDIFITYFTTRWFYSNLINNVLLNNFFLYISVVHAAKKFSTRETSSIVHRVNKLFLSFLFSYTYSLHNCYK